MTKNKLTVHVEHEEGVEIAEVDINLLSSILPDASYIGKKMSFQWMCVEDSLKVAVIGKMNRNKLSLDESKALIIKDIQEEIAERKAWIKSIKAIKEV